MDKLAELQAAGNDPFTITKYDVTAHAADLKADYEATEARLKEAANGDEEAFQASLEPLKEQIVSIAGRIMSWIWDVQTSLMYGTALTEFRSMFG